MKSIIVIFLISFVSKVYGQNENAHHQKYWYYKARLNNSFVKVGLNRGESMPFNQRGITTVKNSDGTITAAKDMNIGDGTSTLGHYIATLATEYFLLKDNHQRTDSVRHELFCALNAFNRCDAFAEATSASDINTPHLPLNGFFIRDDIQQNFVLNNYDHFNYYNNWQGTYNQGDWNHDAWMPVSIANDRGFGSLLPYGQSRTQSSFSGLEIDLNDSENSDYPIYDFVSSHLEGLETVPDRYGLKFNSQDQVYNMLFGLAFVRKFVDEEAKDYDENGNARVFEYENFGETSILQEARNISDRIINHIKNDNNWTIEYPGTNKNVYGGQAGPFSYAIAEAGCFISGYGELYGPDINTNPLHRPQGCEQSIFFTNNNTLETGDYQTWYSKGSYSLYQGYAEIPSFKMDHAVFNANLAAVCNCIYDDPLELVTSVVSGAWTQIPVLNWLGWIIDKIWQWITIIIQVVFGFEKTNVTWSDMTANSYHWGLDYAPLARRVLHERAPWITNIDHSYEYLLDVAPCEGTFFFRNTADVAYEWSSDNRLDHPDRRGGSNDFSGEYNGIDYLLYHNLYYINKQQEHQNPSIIDYSDLYVNANGGNVQAPSGNQFYANGYETIVCENTNVPTGLSGEFRAGKSIHFLPGTTIQSGSNVHVYIEPWTCANTGSVNRVSNSTQDTPQKWHHIDYPAEPVQMKQESVKELNTNAISNTAVYEQEPNKAYQDSVMNAAMLAYVGGDAIMVNPVDENKAWKVYFYLHQGEFANIAVMDMKGNVIATENNLTQKDNGYKIDLSDKANGMYILKFIRSTGKEETKKLLRY